jgi:hypothetical protein
MFNIVIHQQNVIQNYIGGSSGRAWQLRGPEFKPQYHQKKTPYIGILPHSSQNDYHQENKKQKMVGEDV